MFHQFINLILGEHKKPHSDPIKEVDASDTLNWKKWQGQVLGNEGDIKKALTKMGKEPGSATELQEVMDANRREEMKATTNETKHTFY